MMNNISLISIVVPCYNQAQYLPETLQSVYEQTLENWECIIVNDGSPDNTENVALEWCKKDSRFVYLKKENGGLSDARNYGIRKSKGQYIQVLDSDDKISKDYTLEAIKILDENIDVKLVSSRIMLFGDDNEECIMPPYNYETLLFRRNCFYHSCIYRRIDYDKIEVGYNTNMSNGWEDYDFWISLLNRNDKVVTLNKIHFYYRTKQVSMRTLISLEMEDQLRLQIFRNHQEKYLLEINPIKQFQELQHYKSLAESNEYKIGQKILVPLRFFLKFFKKR